MVHSCSMHDSMCIELATPLRWRSQHGLGATLHDNKCIELEYLCVGGHKYLTRLTLGLEVTSTLHAFALEVTSTLHALHNNKYNKFRLDCKNSGNSFQRDNSVSIYRLLWNLLWNRSSGVTQSFVAIPRWTIFFLWSVFLHGYLILDLSFVYLWLQSANLMKLQPEQIPLSITHCVKPCLLAPHTVHGDTRGLLIRSYVAAIVTLHLASGLQLSAETEHHAVTKPSKYVVWTS